jgi:hypothetical protein
MRDFFSFLPILVLGVIASAVHTRYRVDRQRELSFHKERELRQTIQDIELGLQLADRRREEEARILEQTSGVTGLLLAALKGSQPRGLPRRITDAHVAMLLQEIKQAASNDNESVKQDIKAATQKMAARTFLQNMTFFLLGSAASVFVSKYF